MLETIRSTICEIQSEIVALRHELHAHPEIRFQETWTSARVARFLDEAGIPYTRGHARGTGIVAVVEGTGERGVLLRADMDALELEEETGLPYASQFPGRMHACGHDGHTACLCGVAKALARHRVLLKGTVKLVFQPAEEQGGGGRYIVEEGVLAHVQAAFALHAWPGIPAGQAALREGYVMAGADFFRIDIQGRGGHGADPATSVDPIIVAAHLTTALQSVVSREVNPWEAAVLTIGHIEAGSTENIIPDTARMEGTLRALTPDVRLHLRRAIERIAHSIAEAFRASATVTFEACCYPPLKNDPELCALAREVATSVLGPGNVSRLPHPFMTAEDFAFYAERVPGAFLFLGNDALGVAEPPRLHTPRFDFNDAIFPQAIELMALLAIRFLDERAA